MSGEKYPFLEIEKDEEYLLFSSPLQEQARIGYLRGDFGCGTEFWTTWWDQHQKSFSAPYGFVYAPNRLQAHTALLPAEYKNLYSQRPKNVVR